MSATVISIAELRERRRRLAFREAHEADQERNKRERHELLQGLLYGDDNTWPGGHAA